MRIRHLVCVVLVIMSDCLMEHQTRKGPPTKEWSTTAVFYGSNTSFTGSEILIFRDPQGRERGSIGYKLTVLNGVKRVEGERANVAKKDGLIKQAEPGLENVFEIVRPEGGEYVVYPALKGYTEHAARPFTVKLTEVNKENLDGHPCVKYKAVYVQNGSDFTPPDFVWKALDLKGAAIQVISVESKSATIYRLTNVRQVEVDASLFEIPAEYKRYTQKEILGLFSNTVCRTHPE